MRGKFMRLHGTAAEVLLAAAAAAALLPGVLVYLLDRDWRSTPFLAPFAASRLAPIGAFGAMGDSLPSLVHAYAFSVLIMAALWPWPRTRAWVCPGWFTVAATLEIVYGQFDPHDLIATACGCLLAYVTTTILRKAS